MTGKEVTMPIGGKSYTFSRFDNDLRQEYIDWAKTQLPDPFAGLAQLLPTLPKEYADELFQEAKAKRERRGSLNDPDLQAFNQTPEAVLQMLFLCLRKHHGNLTQSEVIEIVNEMYAEHGDKAFTDLFPKVAGKVLISEESVEADYFRGVGSNQSQ